MSERELLKAAARAAGYVIESFTDDGGCWASVAGAPMNSDGEPPIFKWHPRNDDGDALRLAVQLDLLVASDSKTGSSFVADAPESRVVSIVEKHAGDPYAATRRAIVRAAAAMVDKEKA